MASTQGVLSQEKLTLELTTDQFLSKEEIYTRFFAPVSRFIKENGLGELDNYLEHDLETFLYGSVRSAPVEAADLEESKAITPHGSRYQYLYWDCQENLRMRVQKCKTFLEGTWIEVGKMGHRLFDKDVAQQNQED